VPAEGGIPFGSYLLQRRIARGGMAEVFLAQRIAAEGAGERDSGVDVDRSDRRVAVKRILPHHADTADFIRMFLGEARLAAELSHPNIVHIYDFGKVDTDYFIAMEYVEGVDAGEVIRRGERDRMPPVMVARIGADAASALHYAHELCSPSGQPYGLVHRDVSPANLMLSFDGAVKLCDFGIAKAVALGDRPLTRPGLVKGKYAYMSPEQTVGSPLDGRSDVYALAIVIWELLAGRTLVPRGDAVAAMHAIRQGRLTPIRDAAPWAPPALADAITWALATKREQRPNAAQLAEALDAFIAASPERDQASQFGGWLRARFPGGPAEPPSDSIDATHATPSTASAPAALTVLEPAMAAAARSGAPAMAGALSPISVASADTTSRRVEALRAAHAAHSAAAAHAAAAAPTLIAADQSELARGGAPAMEPVEPAEPEESAPIFAPVRHPTGSPPPSIALDNADTIMRSGAFRAPVPSGPSVVPTLIESRPAQLQGSPILGMAALAIQLPVPPPAPRPIGRIALAIGGMLGLAVLSFAIVVSVRGSRRDATSVGTAVAPRAAATSAPTVTPLSPTPAATPLSPTPAATPSTATPSTATPSTATPSIATPSIATPSTATPSTATLSAATPPAATIPEPAPAAARPPTVPASPTVPTVPVPASPSPAEHAAVPALSAAATAVLDVHTKPAGATVKVRRCREADTARSEAATGEIECKVDRAARETPIGDCTAAPCRFALPPGGYQLVVELDGAREVRTVALMRDVATSLDILFKPAAPRRAASIGKLAVRAAAGCKATLDGHTRVALPTTDLELRPGAHKLELQCPRRPTATRSFTITAGKTTSVDLTRSP
jgi:serine/threonine-protein kinase